jgi:hypothetical protein
VTARNGSVEWRGNVESGAGTITVGDGVFKGGYSDESAQRPRLQPFKGGQRAMSTNDHRTARSHRTPARL